MKASSVLHFLILTGRLFNIVGAILPKYLLPYVVSRVRGMVVVLQISGILLDDKQQQVEVLRGSSM